jgi:SAM-dependent methyltransferase
LPPGRPGSTVAPPPEVPLLGEYYKFLWRQGPVAFSRGVPYARCAEYPAVVRRLELGPADRLLDVGSRYSPLPQILAHRHGCAVWAVDPEPDFARRQTEMARCVPWARALLTQGRLDFRERQTAMARRVPWALALLEQGRLDFQVEDAARLPFADGFFTRIACISVLEHIEDEGAVVRELARVLARGGRLVVSVPFDPWRDEPRYYRRQVYVDGRREREGFYMRYYSEKNLRERIVAPSGLTLSETAYFGEPGFNAHNLLFGNPRIPWFVKRLLFQPFARWLAARFIRELPPSRFRRKTKMYTADTAVLVLTKP